MCDTAGTLCKAAEVLMEHGATEVHSYITHGVMSGPAVERITNSVMKSLVITDSIEPTEAVKAAQNIRILPTAPLSPKRSSISGTAPVSRHCSRPRPSNPLMRGCSTRADPCGYDQTQKGAFSAPFYISRSANHRHGAIRQSRTNSSAPARSEYRPMCGTPAQTLSL